MARSERSPQPWPAYPDIPIYLEANDERATAKTYGTTPTTPTTPEVTSHHKPTLLAPVFAYRSEHNSIEPSPTTTIQTCSDRSIIWPVPEPTPEILHEQQSGRPTLRFFPSQRPRVRLDSVPTLQIPHINEKTPISSIPPGLGIVNGPPKPPSIEISAPAGDNAVEDSHNIAERIEKRLYQYSISGNILKRWLLEIVSWICSALCMAAVVAVLIYFKDQPLSDWTLTDKTHLTLNAYISILSKMAGAALILPVSEALGQLKWSWFQQNSKQMWDFEIFDNASRGPWGSFLLLIRTKGKVLAALGAMITLCMMALDPFFQQVVDFPDRWALQDAPSKIPTIVRYEPSIGKVLREGVEVAVNDPDLFLVLDKFSYGNGTQPVLFGNGTRPDIPLSCPTSNCTWPTYETLGVCSKCADVSHLLEPACISNNRVDWTADLKGGFGAEATYPNSTVCGYFLNATSSNPVLMSGYLVNSNTSDVGEALLMRILPLTSMFEKEPLYGDGSINFKHWRNPIADVVIVSAVDGSASSVYKKEKPVAQECVLSWCVQAIQSSYDWGTYHEDVIETIVNTTSGPFPWLAIPFQTELENGTDIVYSQDITISLDESYDKRNISGYGTSNVTASAIIQGFVDIFPAFTTSAGKDAQPVMRYKTWSEGAAWNRQLDFNPWLAPNNVSRHMERLATAMTNVVRSSADRIMVSGEAFSRETYVSVRYEWLTLPIGLLITGFIFLAATVFKSAHEVEQVGVFKNSAILTLLYGLPDEVRGKLTRSGSTGTPRAKAKELKVKRDPKMGWRVSGNLFSPLVAQVPRKQPPPGWI
ncbi:hypothetical protein BDU57DRAFT_560607 [Ampelomyces quisqualis]|uniref:DUF3176 domain containing protein n=1 Tax=Ampelomyces quisqualis TaxID=50730 RepID=A0A6A5Q4P7_AMPQU|nr:hypothetical protein BDU57DRAFT_560607 [Ampelomyces quisqualis]